MGGHWYAPKEEADFTKHLATQARDNAPHYQHSKVGYNYRLSNICAGIGRGQMLVLQQHVEARRGINKKYRELLNGIPGLSFQSNPSSDFDSNMWLTCIVVDPAEAGFTREELRQAMEQENIETRPLWKPMHLQPVFADAPYYGDQLSVSENLFDRGLCLPSHPGLTEIDLQRIVAVIQRMAGMS